MIDKQKIWSLKSKNVPAWTYMAQVTASIVHTIIALCLRETDRIAVAPSLPQFCTQSIAEVQHILWCWERRRTLNRDRNNNTISVSTLASTHKQRHQSSAISKIIILFSSTAFDEPRNGKSIVRFGPSPHAQDPSQVHFYPTYSFWNTSCSIRHINRIFGTVTVGKHGRRKTTQLLEETCEWADKR